MADLVQCLRQQPLLADGAMGSYLFELTGRLSETNHVYEAFNADQPELIQRVHRAYLAAGARCLKTNTFGANRVQLEPFGLDRRVAELNRAGLAVARQAIAEYGSGTQRFVLGSLGPTAQPLADAGAVEACYGEQIQTLLGAGVDALLLETFGSLADLDRLVRLIRARHSTVPIIAEMTIPAGGGQAHPGRDEPPVRPQPEDMGRPPEGGTPTCATGCLDRGAGPAATRDGRAGGSTLPDAERAESAGNAERAGGARGAGNAGSAGGAGINVEVFPWVESFVTRMQSLGVQVVGVNCCAPWDAGAFIEAAKRLAPVQRGELLLAAMPNAGGFQRIGNRFMTAVNPEFMGRMARQFVDAGVRLVGGCCEVHPAHIREMSGYLLSRSAGTATVSVRTPQPSCGDAEKLRNGPFTRKLKQGQFVVSVELLPPRGTGQEAVRAKAEFVRCLAASGLADAVDITDGSRGIPLMPPGDFIQRLRRELDWRQGDGLELIPHFATRDLNVMGMQSRLIGYHANDIHNVLFITGDPPKMSPTYPRSTAVFDLDSISMIRLTHACLNAGVDFGGAPLGKQADPRTHFTIGSGFEPEAVDQHRELDRLRQKLEAGVDYVMTQPAFTHEPLRVLEPWREQRPILVGVMLLTGLAHAERMSQVPGVTLPAKVLERLAAKPSPADQAKVGIEIAAEQIAWIKREGWPGLYLMSPAGVSGILELLKGL